MDVVIRAAATYVFVWVVLRVSGKRSLSDISTFDFVLLLIISETTQAALTDKNSSMTSTFLLIVTMVGIDVLLSLVKQQWKRADDLMEGVPLIILADGVPLRERMAKERVDESDVLHAARKAHGLERLDQIKYAVLERDGGISVIPKPPAPAGGPPGPPPG